MDGEQRVLDSSSLSDAKFHRAFNLHIRASRSMSEANRDELISTAHLDMYVANIVKNGMVDGDSAVDWTRSAVVGEGGVERRVGLPVEGEGDVLGSLGNDAGLWRAGAEEKRRFLGARIALVAGRPREGWVGREGGVVERVGGGSTSAGGGGHEREEEERQRDAPATYWSKLKGTAMEIKNKNKNSTSSGIARHTAHLPDLAQCMT